jgi:acetyl-CoA carboxylase carboxyltransferase component
VRGVPVLSGDHVTQAERFRETRERIRSELGGVEKLEAIHERGEQTVRERIDALVDEGTFREIGTFARSLRVEDRPRTPGDGKIGGHARVDGRPVTIVGDDITVKRATSSVVGATKAWRLLNQALAAGQPVIYIGETGGARLPDAIGAEGFSALRIPWPNARRRRVPMATAIVGQSFGGSSFVAASSDFVVQVRGSTLAVTSPRVVEVAIGERVEFEELGGAEVHAHLTGQIDRAAGTDDEAFGLIRRWLDYLPSNAWSRPPRSEGGDVAYDPELGGLVPERRNRGYDIRRVLERVLDYQSLFELQPDYGRGVLCGLGRIDGHAIGVVANQPKFLGGTLGPDECLKITRLLCLCDAFALPLVILQDCPGIFVGRRVEHNRLLHRVIRLIQALTDSVTPKLTIVLRQAYGAAFFALGGSLMGSDSLWAWPGAEIGFMEPHIGANVLFGEAATDEHIAQLARSTSVFDAAAVMSIDEVIDPGETRPMLAARLDELAHRPMAPPEERPLAWWPMC